MKKSEARKIFTEKRKTATEQQRNKWDDLILIRFQTLPIPDLNVLFTYAAMETEVNTDAIVDYLHFRNPALQVAYPVCDFDTYTMQAIASTIDTPFIKNRYGTPEPRMDNAEVMPSQSIDVVIIPLLCFDKDGYRVGYGKGFYDKFLADTREDVIKIGLSYYEPIDKIEDRSEFDVPLNYCVTPERTYEF
ncbi:5-formyltetrahydrofolate cyclo-ligase [Niabella ginsengisoli]|uniref:5-formyltetrahydrofolate cyclo-ligase n=1 Tax=Niabella ginsengisoli TaxID=522298 RepID=A0ABS9SID9_9BACT|nr:5-formyltetrahydrofolate cyclo-ligase [Niabella ginsengisoli]MCH5598148.1 5-formyltetrahydrofolate cyclo-ligase [Niabella ginsengisoli]